VALGVYDLNYYHIHYLDRHNIPKG